MGIYANDVQKLYIAYFNRPADPIGLAYWEEQITKNGGSTAAVANAFSASAEYKSLYAGKTSAQIVDTIYQNLFGRSAEADGLVYWGVRLENGTFTVGNITMAILTGAQNDDKKVVDNKVVVATEFTAALNTTAEIIAYAGDAAAATARTFLATVGATDASLTTAKAAVDSTITTITSTIVADGKTFTLTTGSDTGTAFTGGSGNDTFVANVTMAADGVTLVDTLQGIDALTGGAGTDTLNVTLNGAGATPTLSGIEIVNLRATGATALNLSAATGVTNVNVTNSTAVATLTSIGAAAVGVNNQNQNVNINGSTATALSLNLDTVGTKTADITIDLGSATANAATSFAITAKDAHVTFAETTASAATTSASVAATGSNEITFAAADLASLTTLTVTGAGDVDFTGAAMTALKTLTAADGGVKVDATGGVLETVTAGAGKDTVTAVGATVKSIKTGAGNDTVNQVTTDLAATATVDLGAGDDSIVFGTKFVAGATVSGGDGTDTIGFAKANYALAAAYGATDLAKVTGFEVLSITDALATGDTIDVSKISGIVSFKAAAGVTTANSAAVSNLGANTSVELAGAGANNGTLTATLKTNTTADSMTLILNKNYADNNDTTANNNAYTHTVVASEIESLIVKATGKQTATFTAVDGYKADIVTNTLTLTGSNALTSVTVTGDQKLVLASTAAMTKLATFDASANTGGVTFDGSLADMTTPTTSVAMTIKGSATAANTLVGTGHADTVVGGAKADTITGGAGGDTITGNGGNDKFVYASGASAIGTGTFDTITDFVANTWGNGTAGAAGTEADLTDATKVTGDVLSFTVGGTASAAKGIKVFVASSAADATTFLANTASADNTQSSAALDSTTNKLYVDVTGDGVTDFYIALTGVTTLTAAAFDIN